MALTIAATRLFPPATPGGTGRAELDIAGVTGMVTVEVSLNPPTGPVLQQFTLTAPGTQYLVGLVVGTTYYASFSYAGPPAEQVHTTLTAPAFPPPPPPTITATPPELAAAHLPVLLTLEAAPSGIPLTPAALLVVVEVQRGGWQEAGRLRGACDAISGLATFDLSEYLKTQFSPTPPNESSSYDTALGIAYRLRYGRAEAFDGTLGDEAGIYTGLAVNAADVVNPGGASLPLALGPVPPYESVPDGYARFRSMVDANGVKNVPVVPIDPAACPARQFVWLHPSGAWVWGLFRGKHVHGTETTDDVVVRRAKGEDYYVGGGDVRDTLQVYSDTLTWAEFQVLRTIRRSRRVYERLASGLYLPVLLEKGSFPDYRETDKLFAVDFTARYPVQVVQTF